MTCNEVPVTSITANGNDGNVPSNAIDKDLNTRWSNLGIGSWIQLDLGSKKSICSVDIAWYRGEMRVNNFVISVSDDGNTFTNKFTGTSSGSTTSVEKYNMPSGTEGRYVRITVNGNTENDWASITEIAVFGSTSSGTTDNVGSLFHRRQTVAGSSVWSDFGALGGSLNGNAEPVVMANSNGRLQVFVVGTDNSLYTKSQTSAGSSTWSQWSSLGGGMEWN